MQDFKLVTRTAGLRIFACPECFSEFATASNKPKCPKCKYPEKDSHYYFALKQASAEINELIRAQGFIRRKTELDRIVDTLLNDFPKVQPVDIWGGLGVSPRDERIVEERYDTDLHQYVEVSERQKRSKTGRRK